MKNSEKELRSYVNSTEQMSHFDDYDSAEGDFTEFDDQSSFDDYNSASGAAQESASAPYVIQYANTTASDITCTYLGFNDNFGATNYGNPTAAVITNLQGGTYGRLIAQSNSKNFVIGKWRFSASGSNISAQLQQTLTLNHVEGSGIVTQVPLNMTVLKDLFQQSTTDIDMTRRVTFDGNTYFTFTLKASATLVIAAYPIMTVSNKALLNGGSSMNKAIAPRLSGKNAAPVIIQTTQDVRGISGRG